MMVLLGAVVIVTLLYCIAERSHTIAHCKVCDFIEQRVVEGREPFSALDIYDGTGVALAWIYHVCSHLEKEGILTAMQVPGGPERGYREQVLWTTRGTNQ